MYEHCTTCTSFTVLLNRAALEDLCELAFWFCLNPSYLLNVSDLSLSSYLVLGTVNLYRQLTIAVAVQGAAPSNH